MARCPAEDATLYYYIILVSQLKVTLGKTNYYYFFLIPLYSHQHGAQFEEVIVFRVLHLHNTPRVQTPSNLLPLHLNKLVRANHSKRNAGLEKTEIT